MNRKPLTLLVVLLPLLLLASCSGLLESIVPRAVIDTKPMLAIEVKKATLFSDAMNAWESHIKASTAPATKKEAVLAAINKARAQWRVLDTAGLDWLVAVGIVDIDDAIELLKKLLEHPDG